jgi:DNA-directed RNA polymerase subunit beta
MLYQAELRPIRGSWLELMISKNDVISVKLTATVKSPATTMLKAMAMQEEDEIMALFADVNTDPEHDYVKSTLAKDLVKPGRSLNRNLSKDAPRRTGRPRKCRRVS